MPPKPKFTKEEIVAAALEMVKENGLDSLTSRELGSYLGSSARPIFTVFRNMEEVQQEVKAAAMQCLGTYAQKTMHYTPAFKQVGMQMILFAMEEPKLFQLLFMTENEEVKSFEDIFRNLGEMAQVCIDVIVEDYGLSPEEAKLLFEHVWVYTFGIGVLCATGACHFTEEEISKMMTQDFTALMMLIKSGSMNAYE